MKPMAGPGSPPLSERTALKKNTPKTSMATATMSPITSVGLVGLICIFCDMSSSFLHFRPGGP